MRRDHRAASVRLGRALRRIGREVGESARFGQVSSAVAEVHGESLREAMSPRFATAYNADGERKHAIVRTPL